MMTTPDAERDATKPLPDHGRRLDDVLWAR